MQELITLENDSYVLNSETSMQLAEFEKTMKELKEKEEEIRFRILTEMEQKNILSIESDDLTISYTAPTTRESFDSKRFKAEHQDLFDEYVNITPVKSSVRIKLK